MLRTLLGEVKEHARISFACRMVIGANHPRVVDGVNLAGQSVNLLVFARILVQVEVLHVQRNLSSQLVWREEALKKEEDAGVVVSASHSNDLVQIWSDFRHEIVNDDDRASIFLIGSH
jgi:hypothetical protein